MVRVPRCIELLGMWPQSKQTQHKSLDYISLLCTVWQVFTLQWLWIWCMFFLAFLCGFDIRRKREKDLQMVWKQPLIMRRDFFSEALTSMTFVKHHMPLQKILHLSESPSHGKEAWSSLLREELVLRWGYDHKDLCLHQEAIFCQLGTPKLFLR